MDSYCLSQYRSICIYTILPIIICIVIYIVFAIYYKVEHKTEFKEAFYRTILQSKLMIVILTTIVSIILIGGDIMLISFNNSDWWFTENTRISKKIGDWGDFATCLAAIFSLISIFYAYRAFRKQSESLEQAKDALKSQVNAAKRASFDATFTQIFAQHKILYDKVMQHNDRFLFVSDYDNIFSMCKNKYIRYIRYIRYKRYIKSLLCKSDGDEYNISDFWDSFNKYIGASASVDFKNYLKYIHNEVEFVASQLDDILDNDAKRRYIQLIQAQMNNDELLCYLINKVEFMYRNQSNLEEDTRIHAEHLKKFKFFIELCRGRSGHVELVRDILDKNAFIVRMLIDEFWFVQIV